ncbi:MAG: alpha-E domain-containing protein [Chloroflexota bacterium]|jgi:uncharacterized alpha-E superfamily protein|nr:alpha-E domain-containing protein [Chloroflexota bacterium]
MLSRVADSLFWMSRYIERAENITRILTINFNALLDMPMVDAAKSWRPLLAISGDLSLYEDLYPEINVRNVMDYTLWHVGNPNSVINCIVRVRENARSVREQISSEMWEHLNRLYHHLRSMNRDATRRSPHEFFTIVRDGSHAFQGITNTTMPHGEGYEFIQLGKYIERAGMTLRALDSKYATVNALPEGLPEASLHLIALLKSCSAFEAFRKSNGSQLQASRVAEFLLLSSEFPRAVRFCLQHCLDSVNAISGKESDVIRTVPDRQTPQRLFGKLNAELEYLDMQDVLDQSLVDYINDLFARINAAGDTITRSFFSTQVILPPPRGMAALQQSHQQQQQQQ